VVDSRVREVTHEASGPYRLGPEDVDDEWGDVAICLCGLAESYPFCDGSHRRTDGEADGVRYKYVDGDRRQVELRYADREPTADDDRDA
jgi:CDGSH-type Zn-finger protein